MDLYKRLSCSPYEALGGACIGIGVALSFNAWGTTDASARTLVVVAAAAFLATGISLLWRAHREEARSAR